MKALSLNFYRYRSRIKEVLKRMEGGVRLKRVEVKDVERMIEEVREAAVWSENEDYEEIRSFEEELARIEGAY